MFIYVVMSIGTFIIIISMRRDNEPVEEINDLKGFSKHFARFGKGMIKNQFTFRGILDNIRRGDYHFVIQWSGERVPRGEFVLVSSKKFRFKGLNRIER